MSKKERGALNELVHDDELTIKPADKGGAIVVMDTVKYKQELLGQLEDRNVYKMVDYNHIGDIKKYLNILINNAYANDIIDKELHKFLLPQHSKTPLLYGLPKIHKNLEASPGRLYSEPYYDIFG